MSMGSVFSHNSEQWKIQNLCVEVSEVHTRGLQVSTTHSSIYFTKLMLMRFTTHSRDTTPLEIDRDTLPFTV
jgi:hypothetical protein